MAVVFGVERTATGLAPNNIMAMGVGTLGAGGLVDIVCPFVTADSIIQVTGQATSAGVLFESLADRVAGTSFRVKSSNAADTTPFMWLIFQPVH